MADTTKQMAALEDLAAKLGFTLKKKPVPKKKMMRGGVAAKTAPKRMRGGGMAKMASKKMMRGGMAKKK
jgi:hypothetical protein